MRGVIRGHGAKTTYWINGKQVSKAEFERAFPDKPIGDGSGLLGWKRPILSDALAVHVDDVDHAIEHAKQQGVPTEFDRKTGRPLIRSHQHQKAYCKAYGFADRSNSNRKKRD